VGSIITLFIVIILAGLGYVLSLKLEEHIEIPFKKYKPIRKWIGLTVLVVAIPSFVLFFSRFEQDTSRFPFELLIPFVLAVVIAMALDFAYYRCPSCGRYISHRRDAWFYEGNRHCPHCRAWLAS